MMGGCKAWHGIRVLICTNDRRRRAWYSIMALGQYTGSNNVGHGMSSYLVDNTHSDDVERGVPSYTFVNIDGWTT